jgi:serine phosphatase RsbU (regulator of sigma subunit)
MKTLSQTGSNHEPKDGIDLTIGIFTEHKRVLQLAGANTTLYHIRNQEIYPIKGDKMPIGIAGYSEESFSMQEKEIKKGDCIYLFTDGFADQFGGVKDKKFNIKRYRQLLLDIHEHDFNIQKEKLEAAHKKWKGEQEQVDDILIMGIGF